MNLRDYIRSVVAADLTQQEAAEIAKHFVNGMSGFTWDAVKHRFVHDGYSVSTHPESEKVLPAKLIMDPTGKHVSMEALRTHLAAYVKRHKNVLDRKENTFRGYWSHGNIVLDVSQIEPNLDSAVKLGKQHKQESVYDHTTRQLVMVDPEGAQKRWKNGAAVGHDCSFGVTLRVHDMSPEDAASLAAAALIGEHHRLRQAQTAKMAATRLVFRRLNPSLKRASFGKRADAIQDITQFQGIPIYLDRPEGFVQHLDTPEGPKDRVYTCDYGFFPGTMDHDEEELDVFLGPDENSDTVWVIRQNKHDGTFDEHKVMLGFPSKTDALNTYADHIPPELIDSVHEMGVTDFETRFLTAKRKLAKLSPRKPSQQVTLTVQGEGGRDFLNFIRDVGTVASYGHSFSVVADPIDNAVHPLKLETDSWKDKTQRAGLDGDGDFRLEMSETKTIPASKVATRYLMFRRAAPARSADGATAKTQVIPELTPRDKELAGQVGQRSQWGLLDETKFNAAVSELGGKPTVAHSLVTGWKKSPNSPRGAKIRGAILHLLGGSSEQAALEKKSITEAAAIKAFTEAYEKGTDKETLKATARLSQAAYKEENVPLYRGITKEQARSLKAQSGNNLSLDVNTVSSWSENVYNATMFGDGAIISTTVPRSSIVMSYRVIPNLSDGSEREVLVASHGKIPVSRASVKFYV
jgi:hypothetical protein